MAATKKILLFSTLNPFPFWAGSENLWFDFVTDERVNKEVKFQVALAESPVTKKKAVQLAAAGVQTSLYNHFNTSFAKRTIYRARDKFAKNFHRTIPWYDKIKKGDYDLVWFNVAVVSDLIDLSYAVEICKQKEIPFWLLLQQGNENYFPTNEKDLEAFTRVALSAKRFIFISKQNGYSVERAIGQKLSNALYSMNAIPAATISRAKQLSQQHPINTGTIAKFFNLGRFSPQEKAQHLLLEAFAEEKWKYRDWQLTFVGVSEFGRIYLKKLISFYDLDPNRIKITGYINNVLEEILKHDVLLMPSYAEGTPFAMIEAMACARPCIGTPVGGIPELIEDDKTGWLCDGIDKNDVSRKLEKAWQQRNQWQELGINAQKLVSDLCNQEKIFAELLTALIEDAE